MTSYSVLSGGVKLINHLSGNAWYFSNIASLKSRVQRILHYQWGKFNHTKHAIYWKFSGSNKKQRGTNAFIFGTPQKVNHKRDSLQCCPLQWPIDWWLTIPVRQQTKASQAGARWKDHSSVLLFELVLTTYFFLYRALPHLLDCWILNSSPTAIPGTLLFWGKTIRHKKHQNPWK